MKYGMLIFMLSTVLCAQQLTLSEAWTLAQRENPALQVQALQADQAGLAHDIQRAGRLPTLRLSVAANYTSEIAEIDIPLLQQRFAAGVKDVYDLSASLQQPVFTGFRIRNQIKASEKQQRAAEVQRDLGHDQLRLQIGQVFYALQLNRNQQAVLAAGIDRASEQLGAARERFFVSQVAGFDTLEAANRLLQLRSQQRQLANIYQVLRSQLQLLTGSSTPVDVVPLPPPLPQFPEINRAEIMETALSRRAERRHLDALAAAQGHLTQAARSQYFPQVFAHASYHYGNPGANFFRPQWMDYYTLGIGLQWELWNGGKNRHQVAQSHLETRKLQLQAQQLVLQIRQQVTEVLEMLESSQIQIGFQQQLVAQEKERYRIARAAYDQGLATSLDVRSAETALTQAEMLLQQHWIEWHQRRLQLAYASGDIGAAIEASH